MTWLARLEINADIVHSEGISNDIYIWHKMLWECNPGDPHAKRDFLTRIDQLAGAYRFWILAQRKPECPQWCPSECFAVNKVSPTFLSHQYYAFDLKANPTKTIVQRDVNGETLYRANGKRKHGKRVPLVKQEELREWLIQKGRIRSVICRKSEDKVEIPGGFRILDENPLKISPMIANHFRKNDNQFGYHGGVQFRGTLEVTEREHFIKTYQSGVGSAKGFGFGLLLLSPINL